MLHDTLAPYSWPRSVSWCLAEGYRKRRSAPLHGPMWLGKDFTMQYKTKTHKIHNLWAACVWRIARGRVRVIKRGQAIIGIDVAVSWLLWFVDTSVCHGRWWVWILCHWHCSLWTDHICLITATLLISQLIKQTIDKSISLSINWLSKV